MANRRIHPKPQIGDTFGALKIEAEAEPYVSPRGQNFRRWWCRCKCETLKPVRETHLLSGKIVSCGCVGRENSAAARVLTTGRPRESGKLSNQQKQEMVNRYLAGESTIALGIAYGLTPAAVGANVQRRGGKMRSLSDSHRKLALNEAAFSEITEASAYWIGFLMADGASIETAST